MGIDCSIYFKSHSGELPLADDLPNGCEVKPAEFGECEDATHKIDQNWAYYSPTYERGPWPAISSVLMTLLATDGIEAVWYFGDGSDADTKITESVVIEYCAHYMQNGHKHFVGHYA